MTTITIITFTNDDYCNNDDKCGGIGNNDHCNNNDKCGGIGNNFY
jgi:hypothetical protein